ncbi:hypothetical protein HOG98_08135 [bacterium]|nr:hypothetical protein [bacterium]
MNKKILSSIFYLKQDIPTADNRIQITEPLSNGLCIQKNRSFTETALIQAMQYIGKIRSKFGTGTCTLLENGSILTSLHAICNTRKMFTTGNVSVNYAKKMTFG